MGGSADPSENGKKPSRMSAKDRRKRILEAALHVFARENYDGATTAKIAEAAGITEPVIYQHFQSKRELFLEVVRINRKNWMEWNAQVLAEHKDPIKRYQALTDMFTHCNTQFNRDVAIIWSMAFHVNDPDIKAELRASENELLEQLTEDIRRSMEAGKISSRHAPQVLAMMIYCIHAQLTYLALVGAFYMQDWVYEDIKRCIEHLMSKEPRESPAPSKPVGEGE